MAILGNLVFNASNVSYSVNTKTMFGPDIGSFKINFFSLVHVLIATLKSCQYNQF